MIVRYFVMQYGKVIGRSNKRFFNGVYVLITLNDLLVSLTLFPVAASLFANREKVYTRTVLIFWGGQYELLFNFINLRFCVHNWINTCCISLSKFAGKMDAGQKIIEKSDVNTINPTSCIAIS